MATQNLLLKALELCQMRRATILKVAKYLKKLHTRVSYATGEILKTTKSA
jgi:hypothetical protein